MRRIALEDLKDRLAECVAEAEAGEILLVTDRDRVVAELVPPRPPREPVLPEPTDGYWLSDEEAIALGRREGWMEPSTGSPTEPVPPDYPRRLTLEQVLADLARDREDR